MKASFKQRCIAYIMDFLFLTSCLMILYSYVLKSDVVRKYEYKQDLVIESFMNHEISFNVFLDDYIEYSYQIDYNNSPKNILNLIFIVIYFIVVPLFRNGQTLGKSIMKIKIVDRKTGGKAKSSSLIIRALIINALMFNILTAIFISFMASKVYFIFVSILSIFQLLLVFVSSYMILYRRDKLSLEDILSGSKVISLK